MDHYLNIAVTRHFADRLLADEYTDTAPMDTLARLIWRSTGIPCKGDKAAYIQSYADQEGIEPVDPVSYWDKVRAEKRARNG